MNPTFEIQSLALNQTAVLQELAVKSQELLVRSQLVEDAINTSWISSCTYLVFLMQLGFLLLEAGSVRHKNYVSSILKNLLDLVVSTLSWWLIGHAFAFGEDHNGFIGHSKFAINKGEMNTFQHFTNWMFQWSFSSTASTIVSGAIQERISIFGYLIMTFFMNVWIYPVIVHWAWHPQGWMRVVGYVDFAGSGVVHMVGGSVGLVSAILIGARRGRFDPDQQEENDNFRANYIPFVALGSLFLYFSWFGFNCGSVQTIVSSSEVDYTFLVGRVGTNTAICGAACGVFSFFIEYLINRNTEERYSLPTISNGILGGLVAVTAGCHVYRPYAAFIIGVLASPIYLCYSKLLKRFKIDDPLDAVAVHFGCGSLGVVAVGFFHIDKGVLYGYGGEQLGYQVMGMVCIAAWSLVFGGFIFLVLKAIGLSKMPEFQEDKKLPDWNYVGGSGYSYDNVSANHYGRMFYKFHMDELQQHYGNRLDSEDMTRQRYATSGRNQLINYH